MIKRICKYGEPILNKKTKEVDFDRIKDKLPVILRDMWDTCSAVKGLGLAANQVGLDLRLAVIEVKKDGGEVIRRLVLINPKITEKSGRLYEEEGCLSFPGFFVKIKRFSKVKVLALNEHGIPTEITGEGLLARALQHEVDHLDGKLFVERLPLVTRIKVRGVLRKMGRHWAKIDESKIRERE